ncbi:MAG: SDR family oxidoreductase [Alphaproteobacteria bacterium]|nr:SDR family oxidoreductase [Alphaproteobacteria bacterium]MBU1549074.1 SDR family oxidoreductase [Alphaproteobacteria bacterium]MBU2338505.1 SDR family oxidoreductase [Alphaproteobacteria bacterium]MBU2389054.1 SDR family oxidoreductase [Alphaproteobacteria bacterium]
MQFSGKSVIITGAGKGIGRACAQLMAARGADVIALSRTASDLDSLRKDIGGRSIAADLADPGATRAAMAEAGTADFLINSAGANVLESSFDMTDAGYEKVMGINLRAALITCQAFGRARVAAGGGGAIVNITSIAGHRGFTEHLCYAAAKAGLEGATRVLAKEFGPHNIRVNAVAPTITLTELALAAWSDPTKSEPMMVRHPLGRFAEVDDVAKTIAMLLSPDTAMVTGAVLSVDGGFLAV